MARIINVEKSQYLEDNIKIYSGNKVGQYSKYLDKNPLFVTWLHINSALSRSDVGTGGIESDVGPNSPIRFNQINNLPTYNIPELNPDTDYGENGYDVEIDISDATLLPNTIIPSIGDYLIISLPNTIEFAFRVNAFNYNTIQSNDFYKYSANLIFTGNNLLNKFKNQIVEEYETIFENIGTDDKCFILKNDVSKIESIGKLFLSLREMYMNNFFDKETGTFVCKENLPEFQDYWLYDKYVERFIMDSEIYYTENDESSIALSCADLETPDTRRLYQQTMFYAVLNRTLDYLCPYPYYYQMGITKPLSPFKLYGYDCNGVTLLLMRKEFEKGHSDALDSGTALEYFSHFLIKALRKEIVIDLDNLEESIQNLIDQLYPVNPPEEDPVEEETPDPPIEEGSPEEETPIEGEETDTTEDSDPSTEEDPTDTDESSSEDSDQVSEEPELSEEEKEKIQFQNDHNCGCCCHTHNRPTELHYTKENHDLYMRLKYGNEIYPNSEHHCNYIPQTNQTDEIVEVESEIPYFSYLDELIYRYLTNHMIEVDKEKILEYALQVNNYTYRTMPLVMYIILEYYNSYFKKKEL